jgi:ADP-heptose:LPS heptosyltransferase
VARWCRLCSESGIPADPADLLLTGVPGTAPPAPSGALPPPSGGPRLTIVHPGAAAPSRRWPPGRFAAVAGELARLGHQVVVTGSAAERPLTLDVARGAGLPPQSVLAGRTSLAALATLTASARLVVSGDTGLAHLATAYARPSVVLFGPVPPAEWGPPADPRHQALWAGGDGYRGDPHGRRTDPALAAIGVSEVLRATGRALAAARARTREWASGNSR